MLIPTKRLYFIWGGIALIPLGLNWLNVPSWSMLGLILGLDTVLLLIAIADGMSIKQDSVQITRNYPERLSIGRDNPITLTVKSSSKEESYLRISDGYPREFSVNIPDFALQLKPQQTQELIYTIKPLTRGEFQWQNIQIRKLSPKGLMWRDWFIPGVAQGVVYPDLISLRELSIRLSLQKTGTIRQARLLGRGTEFAELRDYRQGDDTRLIDWKATARSLSPVVKVLEPEQEQSLIILLDRGRLMTSRIEGMTRFDWGLNATLCLALAGLNRCDRVGVGVFDNQVVTWIPPNRNKQQLPTIIESLSRLQPVMLESDYTNTISQFLKQQTRRSLVVIITDLTSWIGNNLPEDMLQIVNNLARRYLFFYVAIKDPVLDVIATSQPQNSTEIFNQAVSLDLLQERQLAAYTLRQKGVLILDAPANQISTELVNRYLQLKDANRL